MRPAMSVNDKEHTLCKDVKTGVLLLHGSDRNAVEMRPVAKHFTKLGCIVEAPCLPGHGGVTQRPFSTGWKDWVAGAQAIARRTLKENAITSSSADSPWARFSPPWQLNQ